MYPLILFLTVMIFYNRFHPHKKKTTPKAVQAIQLTRTKYTQTDNDDDMNESISTCDMSFDENFFKRDSPDEY